MSAQQLAMAQVQENEQPKSCPFCGSHDLSEGLWSLDDGEVDSIECNQCYAGAPKEVWNARA